MRKIIIVLSLLITTNAFAGISNMVSDYGNNSDTATNTGTAYVQITANNSYAQASFQVVVTKISGTAAGTVILYGSLDGTNFNAIGADTLTNTNVTTNTHVFILTYNPYKYYRAVLTGSGTMVCTISAKAQFNDPIARRAVVTMKDAEGNVDDTITNTGTGIVTLPVLNHCTRVGIQVVIDRISGTAGGTVTLQGSLDGTNYVTVKAAYTTSSTLSVSNVAAQSKIFVVTGSPYKYYRLSYAGTGTMVCKMSGYLIGNK